MTQRLNHSFKLGEVFAALFLKSDISFELLGGKRFKGLRRRLRRFTDRCAKRVNFL
jgi:hypothetical protein